MSTIRTIPEEVKAKILEDKMKGLSHSEIAKKYDLPYNTISKMFRSGVLSKLESDIYNQYRDKYREITELTFERLNKYAINCFKYIIRELHRKGIKRASQAELIKCLIDLLRLANELQLGQQYTLEIEKNIESLQIKRIK